MSPHIKTESLWRCQCKGTRCSTAAPCQHTHFAVGPRQYVLGDNLALNKSYRRVCWEKFNQTSELIFHYFWAQFVVVAFLSWTLWGSPSMCTHTCTCTSAGTLQSHSVFGGLHNLKICLIPIAFLNIPHVPQSHKHLGTFVANVNFACLIKY